MYACVVQKNGIALTTQWWCVNVDVTKKEYRPIKSRETNFMGYWSPLTVYCMLKLWLRLVQISQRNSRKSKEAFYGPLCRRLLCYRPVKTTYFKLIVFETNIWKVFSLRQTSVIIATVDVRPWFRWARPEIAMRLQYRAYWSQWQTRAQCAVATTPTSSREWKTPTSKCQWWHSWVALITSMISNWLWRR